MTTLSSPQCLSAADSMLTGTGPLGAAALDAGWWPKACACLIRLGLETGLDAFWQRHNATIAACRSQRAKLLMLRRYTDRDLARRTAYAWATLSRLTHHHSYEAAPTAGELRHLYIEVSDLLAGLGS